MKKRKKKFNPVKHAQRVNEAILSKMAVCYIADGTDQPINLIDLKGKKLKVTKTMANAIEKFRYKWSIMLSVFGYEKNGKRRMTFDLVTVDMPVFQSDLVDFLNETHKSIIEEFKKNNEAIGACWLASATGRDFSEEETAAIFDKLGVWDSE